MAEKTLLRIVLVAAAIGIDPSTRHFKYRLQGCQMLDRSPYSKDGDRA